MDCSEEKKHEHNRLQMHIPDKYVEIKVDNHEGFYVCSAEVQSCRPYEQVQKIISDGMEELAAWTEEQQGIIGHLKAFIYESSRSSMISLTESKSNIKKYDVPKVKICLTVIVRLKECEELCNKMRKLFKLLK